MLSGIHDLLLLGENSQGLDLDPGLGPCLGLGIGHGLVVVAGIVTLFVFFSFPFLIVLRDFAASDVLSVACFAWIWWLSLCRSRSRSRDRLVTTIMGSLLFICSLFISCVNPHSLYS